MCKGVLTLGFGGVLNASSFPFALPGIGILLIFDRTSVPESIERFKIRIANPTAARRRKVRRLPAKATIAEEVRVQLYTVSSRVPLRSIIEVQRPVSIGNGYKWPLKSRIPLRGRVLLVRRNTRTPYSVPLSGMLLL